MSRSFTLTCWGRASWFCVVGPLFAPQLSCFCGNSYVSAVTWLQPVSWVPRCCPLCFCQLHHESQAEQHLRLSCTEVGHTLVGEVCWPRRDKGSLCTGHYRGNPVRRSLTQNVCCVRFLRGFGLAVHFTGSLLCDGFLNCTQLIKDFTCMIVKDTTLSHEISCILLYFETLSRFNECHFHLW